ncbi:hypothetical protein [Gordonia sputi]|uniref:hypothetical protein n=1 Tax=Gordonia sputi TaxID=36823 RepID=UPI002043970E|nr:hypothetical protein [Gordonia sputi]MCM3895518.1 hypothetical protein [Gordonia sputi]
MGTSDHDDPESRRDGRQFDLNGRPMAPRRWETLRRAMIGSRATPRDVLTVTERDVVVVGESDDEAASSSSILETSTLRPDAQAVVRHVLALPEQSVEAAVGLAALDGYEAIPVDVVADRFAIPAGLAPVVLARVQLVDALHLSQERSRMASLASRHAGVAVGWQIVQRPG